MKTWMFVVGMLLFGCARVQEDPEPRVGNDHVPAAGVVLSSNCSEDFQCDDGLSYTSDSCAANSCVNLLDEREMRECLPRYHCGQYQRCRGGQEPQPIEARDGTAPCGCYCPDGTTSQLREGIHPLVPYRVVYELTEWKWFWDAIDEVFIRRPQLREDQAGYPPNMVRLVLESWCQEGEEDAGVYIQLPEQQGHRLADGSWPHEMEWQLHFAQSEYRACLHDITGYCQLEDGTEERCWEGSKPLPSGETHGTMMWGQLYIEYNGSGTWREWLEPFYVEEEKKGKWYATYR